MLERLVDFARGVGSGFRAATAPDPMDDRYWRSGSVIGVSSSGITVTPELAFQVSCVYLGIRLYAETLSTIPLKFFRESGDDEREVDTSHWLRPILDTKRGIANPWQTAQQFREAMVARMVSFGGGYAEIKPGAEGRALSLWPLDNERLDREQLTSGELRFKVTRDNGTPEYLRQDQVFRIEGLSLHRFIPANVLALARECIGSWLAVEKYEGMFFAQGARPSMIVEHPGKPDEPTKNRLKAEIREWMGVKNAFRVFLTEQGMKANPFGFSPKDAMLPDVRLQLALEACRWLNLPPAMLKAGGSGAGSREPAADPTLVAQEFVDYGARPLAVRIEAALCRDLVDEDDVYPEHILEGLLRGDILKRFQAYAIGIMNGFMSENEVRVKENLNRIEGLDTPVRSVNQDRGGGQQDQRRETDPRQTQPPQGAAPRRFRLLAEENARRVVHRELQAVRREAEKLAAKPAEWAAWVTAFYVDHRAYVADAMQLEPALARLYADRHAQALLAGGVAAASAWDVEAVAELTALTIEEPAHA